MEAASSRGAIPLAFLRANRDARELTIVVEANSLFRTYSLRRDAFFVRPRAPIPAGYDDMLLVLKALGSTRLTLTFFRARTAEVCMVLSDDGPRFLAGCVLPPGTMFEEPFKKA
jgi:hypothetical protein